MAMGGTKKNSNLYRAKIVYNKAIDVAENYNLEISYYHTIQPVFFGSYCTALWQ